MTSTRSRHVDAINTLRVSAGDFAYFRVVSRRQFRCYPSSRRFLGLVRFPAAPLKGPQVSGPFLFGLPCCISTPIKIRANPVADVVRLSFWSHTATFAVLASEPCPAPLRPVGPSVPGRCAPIGGQLRNRRLSGRHSCCNSSGADAQRRVHVAAAVEEAFTGAGPTRFGMAGIVGNALGFDHERSVDQRTAPGGGGTSNVRSYRFLPRSRGPAAASSHICQTMQRGRQDAGLTLWLDCNAARPSGVTSPTKS